MSALYQKYRQATISWSDAGLAAPVDLATDTIRFVFVSGVYVPDFVNDQYLSDIPPGAIVATSPVMAGKTTVNGLFDASDVLVPAFIGAQVVALVIYKDTGLAASSPLIEYDDQANGTIPFLPNNKAKRVVWNAQGIFKI